MRESMHVHVWESDKRIANLAGSKNILRNPVRAALCRAAYDAWRPERSHSGSFASE